MIIQTLSYSRTAQPKQYESVKVEAAGIIEAGSSQTAGEAFAEMMKFVDDQVAAACAATNGAPASTAKSSDPPLGKGKGKKSDPTPAAKAADPPFTPNKDQQTSTDTKTPPTTANGKTATKPAAKSATSQKKELRDAFDKEVRYTMESESMTELASRFIDLTDLAKGVTFKIVGIDEYSDVLDGISDRYQQLNGNSGADPDSAKVIIARGKAERTRLAHALQDAANAKLQESAA